MAVELPSEFGRCPKLTSGQLMHYRLGYVEALSRPPCASLINNWMASILIVGESWVLSLCLEVEEMISEISDMPIITLHRMLIIWHANIKCTAAPLILFSGFSSSSDENFQCQHFEAVGSWPLSWNGTAESGQGRIATRLLSG